MSRSPAPPAIALIPLVTPGPGGQRADPDLPGRLREALGGEGGRLLVAHVDDLDPLLTAAVIDREQVPAGEREQLAHPARLQGPGNDAPPVNLVREPMEPVSDITI